MAATAIASVRPATDLSSKPDGESAVRFKCITGATCYNGTTGQGRWHDGHATHIVTRCTGAGDGVNRQRQPVFNRQILRIARRYCFLKSVGDLIADIAGLGRGRRRQPRTGRRGRDGGAGATTAAAGEEGHEAQGGDRACVGFRTSLDAGHGNLLGWCGYWTGTGGEGLGARGGSDHGAVASMMPLAVVMRRSPCGVKAMPVGELSPAGKAPVKVPSRNGVPRSRVVVPVATSTV